jgi:beta-galactosidase
VKGAGQYRAAANGDATCLDLFHLPQMHLFGGQLTAIVQTSDKAGDITFTSSAAGLRSASLTLDAR